MIVIAKDITFPFDVDKTLIFWKPEGQEPHEFDIKIDYTGSICGACHELYKKKASKPAKKTVAQILKKAKVGDILIAGRRKWKVVDKNFDGAVVASPANKITSFELWSVGVESVCPCRGYPKPMVRTSCEERTCR